MGFSFPTVAFLSLPPRPCTQHRLHLRPPVELRPLPSGFHCFLLTLISMRSRLLLMSMQRVAPARWAKFPLRRSIRNLQVQPLCPVLSSYDLPSFCPGPFTAPPPFYASVFVPLRLCFFMGNVWLVFGTRFLLVCVFCPDFSVCFRVSFFV